MIKVNDHSKICKDQESNRQEGRKRMKEEQSAGPVSAMVHDYTYIGVYMMGCLATAPLQLGKAVGVAVVRWVWYGHQWGGGVEYGQQWGGGVWYWQQWRMEFDTGSNGEVELGTGSTWGWSWVRAAIRRLSWGRVAMGSTVKGEKDGRSGGVVIHLPRTRDRKESIQYPRSCKCASNDAGGMFTTAAD